MIPKKIHYCWFWWNPKPKNFNSYLESWKKHCPDYEIIEWNENNFDINDCEYAKKAYKNKKWAFVVDYVRFAVLEKEGGVYFDTDVELCKSIDSFLIDNCFMWFQDKKNIGSGIIWSERNHRFLSEMVSFYKNYKWNRNLILPYLVIKILKKYWLEKNNKTQNLNWINIYPNYFFYPFAYYETFTKDALTNQSYTIHWYTWTWLPWWIKKYILPFLRI